MKRLLPALAGLLALGVGGFLGAEPILDFNIAPPTSGTISFNSAGDGMIGSNIGVDNVSGLDTPLHDGQTLTIVNGTLDFDTSAFSGSDGTSWHFSGGGPSLIVLKGGIDVNGNGNLTDPEDIPVGTVLMRGMVTEASVEKASGRFRVSIAAFDDWKNQQVTDYYGLPPSTLPDPPYEYSGNFNISFEANGSPGDFFTSSRILSGDVTNSPVPEPTTILLLGTGLVGLGVTLRRRKPLRRRKH